jgi:dihydroxyacetone kinase-like predicted kinase
MDVERAQILGKLCDAVVSGDGLSNVFKSLGVVAIVPGGQTMNPSTKELLQAVETVPSSKVILLPNNKNIILAAQAAAQAAVQTSNKKIAIIPSRTIPQGLSAMMRLVPHGDFDEVVAVGAAIQGMRPIIEVQFADFSTPAFNQIVNQQRRCIGQREHLAACRIHHYNRTLVVPQELVGGSRVDALSLRLVDRLLESLYRA